MKTIFSTSKRARAQCAATLPEMMVNIVLFTLAVLALVTVNLFGLFQDEYVNTMLGASDTTRVNFNQMLDEIRSCQNIQIGTGTYTNFTPTTNGPQQGDTIQILPSTNLSCCIYYYFIKNAPTNSSWLMRALVTNALTSSNTISSSTLLSTNIMAQCLTNMVVMNVNGLLLTNLITNAMIFTAVAYNGTNFTVVTSDPYTTYQAYNWVVDVLLQFYQYEYPLTRVGNGSNYLYSFYQVELAAARHSQ